MAQFKFLSFRIKKISVENHIGEGIKKPESEKLNWSVKIGGGIDKDDRRRFIHIIEVSMKPKVENPPFELTLVTYNLFESDEDMNAKEIKKFVLEKGHFLAWPYTKTILDQLTQSIGVKFKIPLESPLARKEND